MIHNPAAPRPSALDFVTGGSRRIMDFFNDHAVLFALLVLGGRDPVRALPHVVAAPAARRQRAHAGDRARHSGGRGGVPAEAVHDDRDRRDRPVPPARLLQQARLGNGDRLPDRRRALRGRRLHRHERRGALERPDRRGRARRAQARAQRRVPCRLGHGPARRRPRAPRRRRLLLGPHRLARTTARCRRSTTSSGSPSAAR